jgi:Asp-tRNA(Asn)/Glu-tRNA(Gln) amidotransferase A subunit family amidase
MLELPLEESLRRIRALDPSLHCWSEVSPREPLGEGPLSGVPFGIKDIFEAAWLSFECGSPVFAGRRASADAGLVRRLRELGAIAVGKTHTAAFAYFDPAPTRNPHNRAHTPGGSSSGSAAAVAAGMVPMAVGSQTQGSVLRPASFCGVVGFKPTFGLIAMDGVMPFAPTLDTAGFFTATAADMAELWRRMGYAVGGGDRQARLAAFAIPAEVAPEMNGAVMGAAAKLGAPVIEPPESFVNLWQAVKMVQDYEGAHTHEGSYRRHGRAIGLKLAELIERGLATRAETYQAALEQMARAKGEMATVFEQFDVILTPAAMGPAPATLASTGDPRMNAPWTGLGSPAISIPLPVAKGDLPLGLQLTAAPGRDALLLFHAAEVDAIV